MQQVNRNRPTFAPMRAMFHTLTAAAAPRTLPVDILEDEGHYTVLASVPGLTRDQVGVEVDQGVLEITTDPDSGSATDGDGSRPPDIDETRSHVRRERCTGPSGRRIRLPSDVDEQTIEARLEHGLLAVTVGRPVARGPRRIPIT